MRVCNMGKIREGYETERIRHKYFVEIQAGRPRVRGPMRLLNFFKKFAFTSPTSSGRSVGIVHSRTQTMEFFNSNLGIFTFFYL
jgi:hypothetical protein